MEPCRLSNCASFISKLQSLRLFHSSLNNLPSSEIIAMSILHYVVWTLSQQPLKDFNEYKFVENVVELKKRIFKRHALSYWTNTGVGPVPWKQKFDFLCSLSPKLNVFPCSPHYNTFVLLFSWNKGPCYPVPQKSWEGIKNHLQLYKRGKGIVWFSLKRSIKQRLVSVLRTGNWIINCSWRWNKENIHSVVAE